jgi:hypothetical protein
MLNETNMPTVPALIDSTILFKGASASSVLGACPLFSLFARQGGVVLAQRVLFGESAADQQLSVMLTATRAALTQVSALFAEEFFAEANVLIAGFRPHSPDAFKSPSSGRNE